ncbi:Membrane protein [Gossypium australe]|uniref:Membrane protein n=1 Tax=Gossypium australe TaxID=47621 RepID=A0A5B6U9H0_9ROSI|nr:Membrane protein [Gossypium australe]
MGPPSPFHFTPKPLRTTTLLMQFRHTSSSLGPNCRRISSILDPRATASSHLDTPGSSSKLKAMEERIEKGCSYIMSSFMEYWVDRSKVILLLVEAIGEGWHYENVQVEEKYAVYYIYLMGTVMLVFGMGLYELFVCNLDIAKTQPKEKATSPSNLFGLFALKERPRWLEIKSVSELKTKLGHVIVMLLPIGFFDKCKKVVKHSTQDLLCFSASVLLSSGCLFLLSKLNGST